MEPVTTTIYTKLLDYGVLGIFTVILCYIVYKAARYIISRMEANQAKCEANVDKLVAKLEAKDTVLIEISNRALSCMDKNTSVTEELATELRHRRQGDTTPKGNRV